MELTSELVELTGPTEAGKVGTSNPRRVESKPQDPIERPRLTELTDVVLELIDIDVVQLVVVLGERGTFGSGKRETATGGADEITTTGVVVFCCDPGGIGYGRMLAPLCVVMETELTVDTKFCVVVISGCPGNPGTPTGGADVVTANALEVFC